jgi:ABC-type transport system involved in multi-copper enzyme maturation permease subunit
MRNSLIVAGEVLREASRRKLLLALILLTLVVIALTVWGFSRISDLRSGGQPLSSLQQVAITSQLLILVMFMFSRAVTLSAAFVGAPAISSEVESGISLAILARPIARAEYVIGKWLGILGLLAGYAILSGTVELVAVWAVTGYVPPHPAEFLAFIVAEGAIVMTLSLALSTRLAGLVGGVIAVIATGIAWLGGIVEGVGVAFSNTTIAHVGTATKLILPTDGLWRGAVWSLEPAAIIATGAGAGPAVAANPFFAATPPSAAYLLWSAVWVAGVLALAVWSFRAREV